MVDCPRLYGDAELLARAALLERFLDYSSGAGQTVPSVPRDPVALTSPLDVSGPRSEEAAREHHARNFAGQKRSLEDPPRSRRRTE